MLPMIITVGSEISNTWDENNTYSHIIVVFKSCFLIFSTNSVDTGLAPLQKSYSWYTSKLKRKASDWTSEEPLSNLSQ